MADPIYRDRVTYRTGTPVYVPSSPDSYQNNAAASTPAYYQVNASGAPTPDEYQVSAP